MVRESRPDDIDAIMEIWLDSNIGAHSFVSDEYWKSHFVEVKQAISEGVTIYEENNEIKGFIGIREGYIAGLFVKKECRSLGIGEKLIDDAKNKNNELTLHVFLQNMQAIKFYIREEFKVLKKQINEENGCEEYLMQWKEGGCDK